MTQGPADSISRIELWTRELICSSTPPCFSPASSTVKHIFANTIYNTYIHTQPIHTTMSSAEAQIVYTRGADFIQPVEAQDTFAHQFDLSQPDQAMESYQK